MIQEIIVAIGVLSLVAGVTGFASAKKVAAMARRLGEEPPRAIIHVICGVLIFILAIVARVSK